MLYEVITDINPKAPVHVLAIPKAHVDSFNDVTPEMMAEMTAFIQEIAEIVDIKESGYRVITNIRITSYNVCYTKLLRNLHGIGPFSFGYGNGYRWIFRFESF